MSPDLPRRLVAEALGAGLLVAAVVGSGIMASGLTSDVGLALLANALATGAVLVVLIAVLGPLSGAHLNPAVTLVLALRREVGAREAVLYALAQVGGGVAGSSWRTPCSRCPSRRPGPRPAPAGRSGCRRAWQRRASC